LRSILLALFALLFAGAAQAQSAAPVADPNIVRPDPAVRRGVLPNGLRYAVMRNALPSNGVSMRLNIGVGSFEEADEERGIAHFLEHMAFNGTKTIPEGELDTVFAAQGVKFGRDQNAATGAFDTTYQLDLALADKAKLDLGFRWLREVGDGMVLSQDAVERERGVVLAEHDRALGPGRTFAEAQAAFLSPELRGPTRWPIGTRAVLQKIDAVRLRAFYDRWYRPDNAAVVVVGDAPAAELERRVRETFGSWQGRGAAPKRVERRSPALDRGMDILVRSEPQLPSGFSACRPRARDPDRPETLSRWRENTPRWLWQTILERAASAARPDREAPLRGRGGQLQRRLSGSGLQLRLSLARERGLAHGPERGPAGDPADGGPRRHGGGDPPGGDRPAHRFPRRGRPGRHARLGVACGPAALRTQRRD
jgi:zinc protease